MSSPRETFSISGPLHLASVDWDCPHHRRSVAAALVQAVYVLERDRQENRLGDGAEAPPWFEFFGFELIRHLIDDADFSIFGGIFELKSTSPLAPGAPRYIVAFRGTITKKDSVSRDLALDLHFIRNGLHQTSRFNLAMQAVRNLVSAVGYSGIWLTGHSLGSAVATLVGKNLVVNSGIRLETFLFNPPFFSLPIERVKDPKVKQGFRIASSFITAGFAAAMHARRGDGRSSAAEDAAFAILSSWVPSLFVNPNDHICSEYVGYFEHRQRMEAIGAGGIERLAMRNSIGDLLLKAWGKESEPLHLLPSARLVINLTPSADFKEAHGIHQWWKPDLPLESKEYRLN